MLLLRRRCGPPHSYHARSQLVWVPLPLSSSSSWSCCSSSSWPSVSEDPSQLPDKFHLLVFFVVVQRQRNECPRTLKHLSRLHERNHHGITSCSAPHRTHYQQATTRTSYRKPGRYFGGGRACERARADERANERADERTSVRTSECVSACVRERVHTDTYPAHILALNLGDADIEPAFGVQRV